MSAYWDGNDLVCTACDALTPHTLNLMDNL